MPNELYKRWPIAILAYRIDDIRNLFASFYYGLLVPFAVLVLRTKIDEQKPKRLYSAFLKALVVALMRSTGALHHSQILDLPLYYRSR